MERSDVFSANSMLQQQTKNIGDLTCNILEVKAEQGPLTQQKEGGFIQTASPLSLADAWATHYNEKNNVQVHTFLLLPNTLWFSV